MAVKFIITNHAFERFQERFKKADLSIHSLLENSFPFGGQKGSDYYLLNKDYEVVFPVVHCEGNHTVKTVLTLDQAKANLSMKNRGLSFELDISRVEEIRKNAKEEINIQDERRKAKEKQRKSEEDIANQLKNKAREYLSNHRNYPDTQETKLLIKQIKTLIPASNRQIEEYYLGEIGRIIRENDWKILV